MKRSTFLKAASAAAAPIIIPASVLGREGETAPSERVTIGLVGAGGKGTDLMRDFHSRCEDAVRFVYEGGTKLVISNKVGRGTKWIGEDGWVSADRGRIDASNKDWIRESNDRGKIVAYKSNDHRRNFIAGVLTRKECICPAETGHRSVTPGHLGYVSDALKRPIKWDPKNEKVVGDPEADKLLNKLDYWVDWGMISRE